MVNRDITHTSPKRKGKTQELSCLPKLPQLRHWFLILNLIPADSQIIHLFVKASHVIYVHVDSRCAWQENHFSAGKVLWKDLKTSTPASMGICPAAVFATSRTADSSFISVSHLMSILIFILTHNLTLTFIQADLGATEGSVPWQQNKYLTEVSHRKFLVSQGKIKVMFSLSRSLFNLQ